MTHISHLFFALIPGFLLFGTLWCMLQMFEDRVYTYREHRQRAVRCWIIAVVGGTLTTIFTIIFAIAFT